MKQKFHSPLSAVSGDPVRVYLPSALNAQTRESQRRCAARDLLERSSFFHYLPMLCRWRLRDSEGRAIFTSRRVLLGNPMPEIDFANWAYGIPRSQSARFDYRPWHLKIDYSRLASPSLLRRAATVDILMTPVVDSIPVQPERLMRSYDIELPQQEPVYLFPPKSDSQKNEKKIKRSQRMLRHLSSRLTRFRKNRNFAVDMLARDKNINLPDKVAATIRRANLLAPADKIIVALSGGADSVALLAVLLDLGYDCVAAHCNFHLRGAESNRDMRFVQDVCSRLGVDLIVRDFDVGARRDDTGESIEMACRSLRYEWFDQLLTRERARVIAVGHHREDNVETILLNLLRTTGIEGLVGMRYRRDYVIRPLLDCSRSDIENYLAAKGLSFVVDSSNLSDDYLRNRLRNNVIPELSRNFPGASDAILASAANIAAAASVYRRAIDDYRQAYVASDGSIDLLSLRNDLGSDAPTVLRELLKNIGINLAQCVDMLRDVRRSGLRFEGDDGVCVELDRGSLSVSRPDLVGSPKEFPIRFDRDTLSPVNLRVSRHHISEFRPARDPDIIYLDARALDDSMCWSLRHWRKGDRIRPFGMKGSRLVSDLFSDAKYSATDKRNAWLLTCNGEVVWILGLRPSSLFNVNPDSREFLKIIYKH